MAPPAKKFRHHWSCIILKNSRKNGNTPQNATANGLMLLLPVPIIAINDLTISARFYPLFWLTEPRQKGLCCILWGKTFLEAFSRSKNISYPGVSRQGTDNSTLTCTRKITCTNLCGHESGDWSRKGFWIQQKPLSLNLLSSWTLSAFFSIT